MKLINLCTGLLRRDDSILLVRCRYDGEPQPLWTLPGGRQEASETIVQTIVREFAEETGLAIEPERLAYASESIDRRRGIHVVNCTFFVRETDPNAMPHATDPAVVEARFVAAGEAPDLLDADVLRIPVAAALRSEPRDHFFTFDDATVRVPFLRGPVGALTL